MWRKLNISIADLLFLVSEAMDLSDTAHICGDCGPEPYWLRGKNLQQIALSLSER